MIFKELFRVEIIGGKMKQIVDSKFRFKALLATIAVIASLFILLNSAHASDEHDHQLASKSFLFLSYQNRSDKSITFLLDSQGLSLVSLDDGRLIVGVLGVDEYKESESFINNEGQTSSGGFRNDSESVRTQNQVSDEGVLSGRYNLTRQEGWKKQDESPFFYRQYKDDRSYIF